MLLALETKEIELFARVFRRLNVDSFAMLQINYSTIIAKYG